MKSPAQPAENAGELFAEQSDELREFDAEAFEAALNVRIAELELDLARIEDAQFVSNDAMQLEFSI